MALFKKAIFYEADKQLNSLDHIENKGKTRGKSETSKYISINAIDCKDKEINFKTSSLHFLTA